MDMILVHVQLEPVRLLVQLVEDRHPDRGGALRVDCEIDAALGDVRPEAFDTAPIGTSMGFIGLPISGDDAGFLAAGALLDPGEIVGQPDEVGKGCLGIEIMSSIGGLVALKIEPQRGADRPGSA